MNDPACRRSALPYRLCVLREPLELLHLGLVFALHLDGPTRTEVVTLDRQLEIED